MVSGDNLFCFHSVSDASRVRESERKNDMPLRSKRRTFETVFSQFAAPSVKCFPIPALKVKFYPIKV